ncbi:MAG: prolyl oligopeptidase family serine peptidase [Candidatus Nanopelagicales bacterium]
MTDPRPAYPAAERLDLVDDLHGRPVADPYRWLEDPDDPRTGDWLAAQAALYGEHEQGWSMREGFRARIEQLLGSGSVSPPYWRRDRCFLSRREPGQEFAVLLTVDPDGTERVLLDPMALDPSGLTTLDAWQPSKEGDLVAYQLSEGGTEESVLRVLDAATGADVDGPIDRCRYSPVAWLPGGEAFYYVRRLPPEDLPESEQQFHRRVYLHRVGTDPAEDILVFGSGMTATNYYGVTVDRTGRWLQVVVSEGTEPRNDLWLADLTTSAPESPAFRLVQGDVDAETAIDVARDGRFLVSTDLDAPRGRLTVASPDRLRPEDWTDLIAEDPEAVLDGYAVLDGEGMERDLLLVAWTRHAISELTLHDAATGELLERVELPGVGTIGGPVDRPDGGPVVWLVYTDNTTVPHVYAYDGRTRTLTLHAAPPGVVEVPRVFSRQETYRSADGTEVRLSLISPADGPDRPRPTVLYGYGGFGIPLTPAYSATVLAWVEAGGVWAVAHLRGGGEEGEEWHRAGMLGHKQNVFDDFHAAAEHLVAAGWTTAEQLAVNGGSNGGLLVGAAMTQRPDLMNAVVCAAPLLDMVRYTTSELGPTWTVEYGDPDDPEQLGWLLGYSPYHRVAEGTDYPATLFVVFPHDTRTDPMHGRKMCAAVQHATSGGRPVLLRSQGDVGHGQRALSTSARESADMLAFMAHWTGLEAEQP